MLLKHLSAELKPKTAKLC